MNKLDNSQMTIEVLLRLVRLALDKEQDGSLPKDVAWAEVLGLADAQGVAAIAADGLEKAGGQVPFDIKMGWAGRVIAHEKSYQRHVALMAKLAKTYQEAGLRMMVLKGWGLSLEYPVPNHRPSGDLDIWNFGKQQEADDYLASRGVEIDNRYHHHSVFNVEELVVENHYDFINTRAHQSSRRFEERLKELADRDWREKEVGGTTVFLPGPDFNFLFLLRHMANHFVGKEMTLRQLLDWALTVEHHHEEMGWEENLAFLKENGLMRYFNLMALICVERLGFSRDIFHCELVEDDLKERVFNDIIVPGNDVPMGKGVLHIMTGKFRRWWSNRWKHRLCYPDSLLSGFVYGVWAKVQKPAHFVH